MPQNAKRLHATGTQPAKYFLLLIGMALANFFFLNRLRVLLGNLAPIWVLMTSSVGAFDTVILDAGHGDQDRGASIGYIYEKHLALDTTRRVEALLKKAGLKVVMTRSTDVFIPLKDRSTAGNRYGNAIFVSIHYNYSRSGGAGIESFYYHPNSYQLAAYIQAYLYKRTRLINRKVKHASFYVLRNTTRNPAVLVECGFISNADERARMRTGAFRNLVAEGIAQGIVAYRQMN